MAQERLSTLWVSPVITCSFPHLREPSKDQSNKESYNISIPLPKSDEEAYKKLKQVMSNAAVNKWGDKYAKLQGVAHHISEGATGDEVYDGTYKFSAKAFTRAPECFDQYKRPITGDEIEKLLYAGAKIRVSISAYGTDNNCPKTIAFGLNKVMFIEHGPRIGGGEETDEFAEFALPLKDEFSDDVTDNDLPF